jgi:hypothetical protein
MSDTNSKVTVKFKGDSKSLIKSIDRINRTFSTLNGRMGKSTQGVRKQQRAMNSMNGSIVGAVVKLYALRTALNVVREGFTRSFQAVEQFNMDVAQSAALVTSFAAKKDSSNLARTYELSREYARDLQLTLIEINKDTLANRHQMSLVNRELQKQGVFLKLNDKLQIKSFKTIVNTIAVLTAGMPNQNLQFAQEMRAVMEGLARQGTTLSLFLKSQLGANWRQIVEEWKQGGVFLEKMAGFLKGFDQAALDFKFTWAAVGSAIQTTTENIARVSFKNTFDILIRKLKALNDMLENNTLEISKKIGDFWNRIGALIATVNVEDLMMIAKAFKLIAISLGLIATYKLSKTIIIGVVSALSALIPILPLLLTLGAVIFVIARNTDDLTISMDNLKSAFSRIGGKVKLFFLEDSLTQVNNSIKEMKLSNSVLQNLVAENLITEQQLGLKKGRFSGKFLMPKKELIVKEGGIILKALEKYKASLQTSVAGIEKTIGDNKKTNPFAALDIKDIVTKFSQQLVDGKANIDDFVDRYKAQIDKLNSIELDIVKTGPKADAPDTMLDQWDNAVKRFSDSVQSTFKDMRKNVTKAMSDMFYEMFSQTEMKKVESNLVDALEEIDSRSKEKKQDLLDDFNEKEFDSYRDRREAYAELQQDLADLDKDRQRDIEAANKDAAKAREEASINLIKFFKNLWDTILDTMYKKIAEFLATEIISFFIDYFVPGVGSFLKNILNSGAGGGTQAAGGFTTQMPMAENGMDYVPADMPVFVHKGEMIVPAAQAQGLRQGQAEGSGMSDMTGILASKLDLVINAVYENKDIHIGDQALNSISNSVNDRIYSMEEAIV